MSEQKYAITDGAKIHESANVYDHVNLYKCEIGAETKVDAFVYIEEDVTIGNNCTIRPFVFIPTGVNIEDDVFIGPSVTFTNDRYPQTTGDWKLERTTVEQGASIGAGATILPGVKISENAIIAAGAVVTDDIAPGTTVAGNPASPL